MTTPPTPASPYAAEMPAAGPNSLARASFIIAIVLVFIAIVLQSVSRLAPLLMMDSGWDASQIGILFGVFTFVNLVLGVFGFAFGLIGSRRGGSQLLAGIGVGIGGLTAILSLLSLVSTPLFGLLY